MVTLLGFVAVRVGPDCDFSKAQDRAYCHAAERAPSPWWAVTLRTPGGRCGHAVMPMTAHPGKLEDCRLHRRWGWSAGRTCTRRRPGGLVDAEPLGVGQGCGCQPGQRGGVPVQMGLVGIAAVRGNGGGGLTRGEAGPEWFAGMLSALVTAST